MAFSFLQRFGLKDASKLFGEKSFLGVDIGSSSIKVVQLRKERERAILETYGELSLARYSGNEVGRPARVIDTKLAEALGDLMKEAQVKTKDAIVGIPLHESFLTTMDLPVLPESELKEAVSYEARKYIPVPISEVVLDWWVLPSLSEEFKEMSLGTAKKKFQTVILAAVPKEAIAKYKNIFEKLGMNIRAFEIEIFAMARAVLRQDFGTALLLDMGASSTKMAIVDGGVIRLTHSIDRGSAELTLALSQSLSLDFDRAELLKRETGILHRPETEGAASVMEPLVEFMASEAERLVMNWQRKGGKSISKIIVSGGGGLLRGVEDLLIKKHGVEVSAANPFSKVVYPAILEAALKEIGPTFSNAVGLALREF